MTRYLPVQPGVNLTEHLVLTAKPIGRTPKITKTWVRAIMREHPEWDWRIVGETASVNGEDAIRSDLTLEVMARDGSGFYSTVAMINFQSDPAMPFGYKAVVR